MKDIQIVLCTPDMHRPTARKCIERLKATDLSRAELNIIDNAYDKSFSHPAVMESFLRNAEDTPIIFLDDDVFIEDRDWIYTLWEEAAKHDAAIAGCIHTFESGEINHQGVLVYDDASTELLREPLATKPFVPAVSSAVMLVKEPKRLSFNTALKKYQHDIDICLLAWQQGMQVICCSDLQVVHIQAEYMSTRADFRPVFAQDSQTFQEKWREFTGKDLYGIPELLPFGDFSKGKNWERFYNEASLKSTDKPELAIPMFQEVSKDCPHSWRRANAYYHLYRLEGRASHLENCLQLNPDHMKARYELDNHLQKA